MKETVTRAVAYSALVALMLTLAAGSAVAGQKRSQSLKDTNDACQQAFPASDQSYRVDWTSYWDGVDTWWGYVESADNTGTATLTGVDVFATPADLVGDGSMDSDPPAATVTVDSADEPVDGVVGFYGRNDVWDTEGPFALDTYEPKRALGSFTVCMTAD